LTAEHADGPATGRPALVEDTDAVEGLVFDAVVEEMVAEFTRVEVATRAQTPARADGADDLEPGLADAMDQEAEVGGSVPSKVEPVIRATAVEPLEVGDDLYPGEAFALNREAQGLDEPAPAGIADPAVEVPAGNQLKNAVRLTRDAVYAWMNLIQSPAIVTIPR
jgi:hypothetical protein